jgi:hypothetical protein
LSLRDYFAYAFAVGSGLAVWIIIPLITGDPEAWNSGAYWKIAIPALTMECAILGYFIPERWWHWGIVVTIAQAIIMLISWPTSNLLPPSLIFLSILSIPYLASAFLFSRLRRKKKYKRC